jgi:hypothetical protein
MDAPRHASRTPTEIVSSILDPKLASSALVLGTYGHLYRLLMPQGPLAIRASQNFQVNLSGSVKISTLLRENPSSPENASQYPG